MKRITDEIAPKVGADTVYRNAQKNTPNATHIELEKALQKVALTYLNDDTEFFKQFMQNESFKRFVTDTVYALTTNQPRENTNQACCP